MAYNLSTIENFAKLYHSTSRNNLLTLPQAKYHKTAIFYAGKR
jgi:hypothetical protein